MTPLNCRFISGMITGGLLVAAGMFLGGLAPQAAETREPVDELRTRSLQIVDELGTVVLAIGQNDEGGSLSVRDRFGKTVALIGASRNGGIVIVNDSTGQPQAAIRATSDQGGRVALSNAQNALAIQLSCDIAGAGVVETYGEAGVPLVSIGATIGGQGRLTTYSGADAPLVSLTASADHHGQLYTYSSDGKPLIALASRPAEDDSVGAASLRVFNSSGEAVVTLEPTEAGNGEIGVWNPDGTGKTLKP